MLISSHFFSHLRTSLAVCVSLIGAVNWAAAQGSCATAVPVTDLTGAVCATATPNNTSTVAPPLVCGFSGTFDTWFSFTAQGGTANFTISNAATGWRPEFMVLSSSNNTCTGTFTVEDCFDQNGNYTSISGTINGLLPGTPYWVVVSSNGNLTTGTINVCIDNPAVILDCVDNDDCSTATTIPLNATGGGAACVTDCNNGAAPGLSFTGGTTCSEMLNPTAWYSITVGATTATLDIDVTSAAFSNPEFALFTTAGCVSALWTTVECVEGTGGTAASAGIPVSAGQTYLIAVSDATGDQGNFNLCITQNVDNSACNTNDNLQVTATSMGSPFTGPFKPGEQVTFCYTVTDYTQFNCNYIAAFVPTFGDCWAPSSFNAQGMPVNVNTPLNVNGVVQPCPPGPPCQWDACEGTAVGAWNWFTAGSVTYNVNGYYAAGTPMPAGWYFLSSYDPATGNCAPDPTDPDNTFGDGNFPDCGTNTFDYTLCFTLTAGPSANCGAGLTNCSVSIKTFADGEFGAWGDIGCTGDQPFNLPGSLLCCVQPTIASTVTNVSCNGGNNGAINLTITDGTAPYTFNWGGGITTQNRTGLAAGTYTVTVTEADGCSSIASITVTQPSALNLSATTTNVLCNGGNTGAINLTVSGGTSGYSFNWGGGITVEDRTGLAAGTYTVTVTDAANCTATLSRTITQPASAISLSTAVTNVLCRGNSTGAINLTASGGTPGYTFNWGGGITTEDRTGLAAGTYAVTVTDLNLCTATASVTVTQPAAALTASTAVTNPACNGAATGAINLSPSGGTPNYTFNWGGGVTTEDRTNIAAGTYTVTVTDFNGCTTTASATLTQPTAVSVTVNSVINTTCGASNGAIDITPSGGTAGYTYQWSNGATTQDVTGLATGSYTVTVRDANNCSATSTTNVSNTAGLSATTTVTAVSCNGANNGAINLTPSGGTGPYTFVWSNTATTEDISGLVAGTYSVTITDATLCQFPVTGIAVTQPAALTIATTSQTNVSCNGGNNGAINITPSGGSGTYTFTWSNGATTEDITGLTAGTYTVTVSAITGSTVTTAMTAYTQNFNGVHGWTLNVSTGANGADNNFWQVDDDEGGVAVGGCGVANNGDATLHITSVFNPGGGAAYDAGGLCGNPIISICPQTNRRAESPVFSTVGMSSPTLRFDYIANGQALIDNASVWYNSGSGWTLLTNSIKSPVCGSLQGQWTLYNVQLPASCANNANVRVGINWTNNDDATGSDPSVAINNLSVVDTVSAGGGTPCIATSAITITQPSALSVPAPVVTNVACNGGNNGAVNISPSGGTAAYAFVWSNGASSEDITGLSAGNYTVTVRDANNCITVVSATVTQPSVLTLPAPVVTNVSCNGGANGAINISPAGGTTSYNFTWSNTASTEDITGLAAGTYSVTVFDANSCSATTSATVNQPTLLSVPAPIVTDVTCNGNSNGAINISPTGGTASYSFTWSNTATTEDITGLGAGAYSVTVLDANNCTATTSATITEPSVLTVATPVVTDANCNNSTDGAVDISVSGGTASYSYLWSNGDLTQDISNLLAGGYTVTVTDANNCTASASATVAEPTAIGITIDNTTPASCGASNGTISISVSGGTGAYTFLWSNTDTNEDVTGLAEGSYIVTVTDANNCSDTALAVVGNAAGISATSTIADALCNGAATGSINISPTGGTQPYTFLWSNSANTEDVSGLSAGTYSVTVTDVDGCQFSLTGLIVAEPNAVSMAVNNTTQVSCNGGSNAAIDITASGGTGAYTYQWSNTATSQDLNNIAAGSYTVTITDANSCTFVSAPIVISQPTALVVTVNNVTDASCTGVADGAVAISVNGGTGAYSFLWSNNATSEDLNNVTANTYTLTVTDANNCTATASATVGQAVLLDVSISASSDPNCAGSNDGSVTAAGNGGTPNYTFDWGSAGTGSTLSNLAAGTYVVTLTDANGCSDTASVVLTEPAAVALSIDVTNGITNCDGSNDGALNALASGGTGTLDFVWSNTAITANINGLSAGTYTVTATDDNGCSATATATITAPFIPSVNPFIIAMGTTDTTINWGVVADINGGNDQSAQGVTYQWTAINNPPGNPTFGNASAHTTTIEPEVDGTYTLQITATSVNGCTATATITVTVEAEDFLGMPNAFTPNGDQLNDRVRPVGINPAHVISFRIYNRFGEKVYDFVNDPTLLGWDGDFKNQAQARDQYTYVLEYQLPSDAEPSVLRGEVMLIR